jgi:hypothetical protein
LLHGRKRLTVEEIQAGKTQEGEVCRYTLPPLAQSPPKYRASGKFVSLASDKEMKQTLESIKAEKAKQSPAKCTPKVRGIDTHYITSQFSPLNGPFTLYSSKKRFKA